MVFSGVEHQFTGAAVQTHRIDQIECHLLLASLLTAIPDEAIFAMIFCMSGFLSRVGIGSLAFCISPVKNHI
jgi:hypothetical protein